ncbi:unnamed protein product, partial [Owenia fusiformis]
TVDYIMEINETLVPTIAEDDPVLEDPDIPGAPPWNYVLPFIGMIAIICIGVLSTMYYLNSRKTDKNDNEPPDSDGDDHDDGHSDGADSDSDQQEAQNVASTSI